VWRRDLDYCCYDSGPSERSACQVCVISADLRVERLHNA